jgi:uncharacterized protein (TIGR02172 family)
MSSDQSAGAFTFRLPAKLNAEAAALVEDQLKLEGLRQLILDFRDCTYLSSAGIRTVLTAHKSMLQAHGGMIAANVRPEIVSIFELTGLSQIITIKKKLREICLDGVELLSSGVCGECYRLDPETVVKLYREGVVQETAEREKQYARAAFVMGIPTAISYDLVACGSRSGIVYEMLDAELLSSLIRNDVSNVDGYAKTLSDIAQTIHAAEGDPSVLPNLKSSFRGYLQQMKGYLADSDIQLLSQKLEALPDAGTCVHFDLHTSNVMIRNGEPVIIDMGDFSIGSYLFDIGLLYFIYGLPELGISMLATRIPADIGLEFWNCFERHYFSDRSEEEHELFRKNRYFLASLRLIFSITFLPLLRDASVRMLQETLLPRVREELTVPQL